MVIALTDPQLNKWLYRVFPPAITRRPALWEGLQGLWKPSLGVTGNRLRDVSMGNHGTLIGGTKWVIGDNPRMPGYVLDFDGVDDFIDGMGVVMDSTSHYTVSMWVKRQGVGSGSNPGLWRSVEDQHIWFINTSGVFTIRHDGINGSSGEIDISDNLWHNIVTNWDGAGVSQYLDGNFIAFSADTSNTTWTFNNFGQQSGEYFNGLIADVRIYNRVLTSNEITDIYVNPNAMFQLRDRVFKVPAVVGGVKLRTLALTGAGK